MQKCHSGQCSRRRRWWRRIWTTCIGKKTEPIRQTQTMKEPMLERDSIAQTSRERSNNRDQRASFRRTCSVKPGFDQVRGGFEINGTEQRWSGDSDKHPHKQYRRLTKTHRAHNYHQRNRSSELQGRLLYPHKLPQKREQL